MLVTRQESGRFSTIPRAQSYTCSGWFESHCGRFFFFAKRAGMVALAHLASLALLALLLAPILRLTLCLAVIFYFTSRCSLRSLASCLLVAIPQLAITSSLLT